MNRRDYCLLFGTLGATGCLQLEENPEGQPTSGTETATATDTETSEDDTFEVEGSLDLEAKWTHEEYSNIQTWEGQFVGGANQLHMFDRQGNDTWVSEMTHPNWRYLPGHGGLALTESRAFVGSFPMNETSDEVGEGKLFAFDRDSSEVIWEYETEGETRIEFVAATEAFVFCIFHDRWSKIQVFDAETGATVWQASPEERNPIHVTASDDSVYATTTAAVIRYDAATGERQSATQIPGVTTLARRVGDRLYLFNDTMAVFDISEETLVYRRQLPARVLEPVFGTDVLCRTYETAVVEGVDLETGDELWTLELPGEIRHRPAIGGDVLWVSTTAGAIFAIDVATGTGLSKIETEMDATRVAALDGIVFVQGQRNTGYAYERTA